MWVSENVELSFGKTELVVTKIDNGAQYIELTYREAIDLANAILTTDKYNEIIKKHKVLLSASSKGM